MRLVLLSLFVALNSTVQAEPIEISLRTPNVVGPVDGQHVILARFAPGQPSGQEVFLSIPVAPAHEGMSWSVTEANAASFSFDWALLEGFITSPLDLRFSIHMRSDGSNHVPGSLYETCNPWRCILDFQPEQIDVTLHRFDLNPRRVDYSVALIGTGRVVPEPSSSVFLLSVAAIHCLFGKFPRRRHRV